jgi:EamA domain-containing membrane protein RarD
MLSAGTLTSSGILVETSMTITLTEPIARDERHVLLCIAIMFFFAVRLMPLAEATTLSLMSPLCIAALSVRILGEHLGTRRSIAVILGFVGVIVMTHRQTVA